MGARGAMGARSAKGAKGALTACLLISMLGCAAKATPVASPAAPAAPSPAAPSVAAASVELPDGPGRQILRNACVSCHSLTEVTKFRGFYTRPQWRDIVLTMVDYGAPVNEKEVEILSTYLTESLGKK
jgi:cytochrome c5